ncbi:MAG: tail fiber domain-containing protein [Acholeplasmataceae bacterium]|nr:tail fiber domain-containing protein [Acholeplasmataceae bacterium]
MRKIKFSFFAITLSLIGISNSFAQEIDVTSTDVHISGKVRLDPTSGQYTEIFIDNTGYYGGAAIRPESNNSSNIGTSSYAFKYLYAYNRITPSDIRQKENIKDIDSALYSILKLQGVKYDLKKEVSLPDDVDEKTKEKLEKDRKDVCGLIAQDVNKIIPEVIVYDDETDIYGIDYSKLVPYLIEAIKEQQEQIEELEKRISKIDN